MTEPEGVPLFDVTRPADRARGLRRYVDRAGHEWTQPRPGLTPRDVHPDAEPSPKTPAGFREITLRAYTDGKTVVIEEQDPVWLPEESDHDCDVNGCGWVHVLARFKLPVDTSSRIES